MISLRHLFLPPAISSLVFASLLPSAAEYTDDIGYVRLKAELGAATPNGAGLSVAQIEAPSNGAYAPLGGSGTFTGTPPFAGKQFTLKSGDSQGSFHASEVGRQFYGDALWGGRFGMATGITGINCHEANNWAGSGMLTPIFGAPFAETKAVQNHSWANGATAGSEATFTDWLRRLDFAVRRDGFLCSVGTANDPSGDVPVLLASAYNIVSVGVSSGQHNHGLTISTGGFDGPGRVKPEMVAPSDFTSYATAMVSAAATCLRQAAATANSRKPETLKAILMAGATKQEFPGWARTSTRPLDLTFGAGELNIHHSYHILMGGEQPVNAAAPVAATGWDYGSISPSDTRDYLITIAPTMNGAELSAVLAWNRIITDSIPGPGFSPSPSLPNLTLTLYRTPGTPGVQVDSSASPVDNIEHIHQPSLLCGTFRLRVTSSSASDYALAWRVTPPEPPAIRYAAGPAGSLTFSFTSLVPGQAYELAVSPDLASWSTVHAFTAATATLAWVMPFPPESRRFYRLQWTCQ
ncbi:MAG: hypothetical protein KA004_03210 [Verrucomicrobiales bacterium]|nr:hypothetical protein [Verrucomicrobiales bacterium]